ncbi:MAG: NAD-dependent epimerase/dehydratase family protein [Candidatus Marinimicrobia bacterium]|nr:NAD-dependent epimerase/dehydratase family protein [Candidatus Neomarinimicrobiota bacterium]
MKKSRREFLKAATFAATTLGLNLSKGKTKTIHYGAGKPISILILGGTGFIGPHMVRSAQARGHVITLFNRGKTNTHLFPEVEKLKGDRENDLESLKGRKWDVVIDNSAIRPWWVRDSAQLLKHSVDRYLFTSTRSTYADFSEIGMDENSPQYDPDPTAVDERRRLGYGQDKVLCEREARKAFGDRTLIVRPGLIVGPGDNTDRFTYWPVRIDRGGEVLAPGDPENGVMFIDVRDLAEWYIRLIENGNTGSYNALGPQAPLSFAEFLYGCRGVTNANVSFTWVDTNFLLDRELRPYREFPCWMPAEGDRLGFQRFDLFKPLAAGLTYRPLAVTAFDTLEWYKSLPDERTVELKAGISAKREFEVLAEWHAKKE